MPGSVVKHAGSIRLRPGAAGRARVALRLSYVLPPSPFGDQVAALVQADGIDDALRGWKASLE